VSERISKALEDRLRKYLELIAWLAKRLRQGGGDREQEPEQGAGEER